MNLGKRRGGRANLFKKTQKRIEQTRKRLKEVQRLIPLLLPMGIKYWPKSLADAILVSRQPKPVIEILESAQVSQDAEKVKKAFENAFEAHTISFGDSYDSVDVSINEFISVLYGIHLGIRDFRVTQQNQCDLLNEGSQWIANFINSNVHAFYTGLLGCSYAAAGEYSSIDNRVFWFRIVTSQKTRLLIQIGSEVPPMKYVNIKGGMVPVYRLGWDLGFSQSSSAKTNGLTYIDLDGKLVGRDGILPVYAHRHVLRRLKERLSVLEEISKGSTNFHLVSSLQKPLFSHVRDNLWLFEYHYAGIKVGYLGIEVVDDVAVVKTFIFLTMRGTPERKKLIETLGVEDSELEWHGLDDLSSFLKTDLFDDPNISGVLKQCGIEQLERLRKEYRLESDPKKMAEHLKKYLQFEPEAVHQVETANELRL